MLGGESVWAEGLAEGKSERVSGRGRKGRRAEGAEKGDKGRGSSLCEGAAGRHGDRQGYGQGCRASCRDTALENAWAHEFLEHTGSREGAGSC